MNAETLTVRQPCPPFCWQNKIVLNFIRRHTAESILPNSLLVYFVLTELASDEHAAEDFRAKHEDVVKKCGVSRRTIISRLQGLEKIGVLSVFPNFGPDGRKLPSSIRLHTPEELPANGGVCATIAPGVCAIAHGGDCTSSLIRKNEEEYPHTPKGVCNHPLSVAGLEEVKAYAVTNGLSVESAERFHRMNEAGGWRDRKGKEIRNWRKAFLAFSKTDTAPGAEIVSKGSPARRSARPSSRHVVADHAKGF